jgi:hypothetical protein
MAKWEDYCVTKLSFDDGQKRIVEVVVHEDFEEHIGGGMIKPRSWLVDQANQGVSFCSADRSYGGWNRVGNFTYGNGAFKFDQKLHPEVLPKRKSFLSFYHEDDESYRERFEKIFRDLIVNKCVEDGDIDAENSDEYIKQLIQKNHLEDTTVLIVLVGSNTKHRMHVDWEISGALNLKVGDKYSGLLGIVLPTHPDYKKTKYYANLPTRLAANVKSGYAELIDWHEDRTSMQKSIEKAFSNRGDSSKIVNRAIPQMTKNTN